MKRVEGVSESIRMRKYEAAKVSGLYICVKQKLWTSHKEPTREDVKI